MRINQIEIGFVLESLLFSNAGESYMIKAVKCTYKRECYDIINLINKIFKERVE